MLHPKKNPLSMFITIGYVVFAIAVFAIFLAGISLKEIGGSNHKAPPLDVHFTTDIWKKNDVNTHKFLSYNHETGNNYLSRPYLSGLFYVGYQFIFETFFESLNHWSTYLLFLFSALVSITLILSTWANRLDPLQGLLGFGLATMLIVGSSYAYYSYYYFHHANFFSLVGIAIGVISAFHANNDMKFGLPIYLIFLIPLAFLGGISTVVFLAFFIFFEKPKIAKIYFIAALIILIGNILVPYLLGSAQLVGSGSGSSLSGIGIRTGLNGITDRFTTHFQALFDPSWQGGSTPLRRWIPITGCLLIIGAFSFLKIDRNLKNDLNIFGKTIALSLIGYLTDWVIFPQSVSVHPWLYDFCWMMPLFIATLFFVLRRLPLIAFNNLNIRHFYIGIAAVLVMMMNLVQVAQLG